MNHRELAAVLTLILGSALLVIGSFALLIHVLGPVVLLTFAGLLALVVLLALASDVRRAFRTTRQTRFPLAPDPCKRRVRSWECGGRGHGMRSGGGFRG